MKKYIRPSIDVMALEPIKMYAGSSRWYEIPIGSDYETPETPSAELNATDEPELMFK